VGSYTVRSDFTFAEDLTSVFRPTKRSATSGQMANQSRLGMPSSFAENHDQPCKFVEDDTYVFVNGPRKPSPSVKFDVAIVPQKEWDQLFEMALKAASWRIVTPDIQSKSSSL
jgi:hypothetical protein